MHDLDALASRIKTSLRNPSSDFWTATIIEADAGLCHAQSVHDETGANRFWFLHKVALVRHLFIQCVAEIKTNKYYEAWCRFEQVEIKLSWLRKNPFYDPAEFEVGELERQVADWQSLFPYAIFFSPAILQKRKECGICRAVVDPWTDCGHEVGKVYCGNECIHIVTDAEVLEISIVRDPVQKYSVAHTVLDKNGKRVDHHDYSLIKFVADRLISPFDGWSVRKTKTRHPHSRFLSTSPEDTCPCESGRRYADCCLTKPGVLRPHFQIGFEKPPPSDLPAVVFSEDARTKAADA